ncbi:MAG: T9SS type A sorting domain-containing protein [Bacteroidales bacterium]|jgi:hypothetical protein
MFKRTFLYLFLFFHFLNYSYGQEFVIGLSSNPLLQNSVENAKKSAFAGELELPFFEDFSGTDIFPNSSRWTDNFVFINNTYSNLQPSTGIATFDALDNTGRLYENASYIGFKADQLTSVPINLNYPANQNIRLSFFYQPGGLGDMPEEKDSLVLHFFAPEENKWYSVWKAIAGNQTDFKAVSIGIDESKFLKTGFRFRFINYASLSDYQNYPSMIGNCDHWNLDYIVLDRNRKATDTLLADVAFRYPPRSLLQTYESMPWKQFEQISLQEMGSVIPGHYRNNDSIVRNVTRNFEIWDVYEKKMVKAFSAGAVNIDPFTNDDFNADLIYTFKSENKDSALFKVISFLITDDFDPKINDTVIYYQRFSNYFAFDDGSAEAGYGINGLGSNNAMVAYRFRSFMEDTLRAISICFNDSYQNANLRTFDLMVWDDAGGIPGTVLCSVEGVRVEQGSSLNGFYTYKLPKPVMVDNIFYVGWKQRSETFLNAGFDLNTPHGGRQLYWINGVWYQSGMSGTLMIRPVMGPPLTTGIRDIRYNDRPALHFWPNPSREYIVFDPEQLPVDGRTFISVTDMQGREILNTPLADRIDISSLHEGMYVVVAIRNGLPAGYSRLIKLK